ncbi:hypothetical protein [Clavibacter michiganensis]|uniref:hypothetical protein n=1 Tax=Clavibacter michiganensis TaxID=28447 RepID=UPI001269F68D|nr:hypothetical protein [Clavibacter michiganensis]
MRRRDRHPGSLGTWRLEPDVFEIDPRVPAAALWPRRGIIGFIGSGPHRGQRVIAHAARGWTGRLVGCTLQLPVEQLHDADDYHPMDDDVVDHRIPGRDGGLVDELTRLVDVTWSTDEEADAAVWAALDAQRARWRDETKRAKRVREEIPPRTHLPELPRLPQGVAAIALGALS